MSASAATIPPAPRQHGAMEEIRHNIALMRPGATCREISERAWRIPDEYVANRYGCLAHGVGLCDEFPAVKHRADWAEHGYDGTLHPGMVMCVESYIGSEHGGEGVKLEEQVLITEGEPEVLSSYPFEADWL